MVRDDTIAAPATPPGEGGVAIVRISGSEAFAIGSAVFSRRLRNRRAVFGEVRDPANAALLDEALGLLMRGPRSFTGEDVVELHLHGGPVVVRRVLESLYAAGARPAEPGEFTLRAFLNGRIDLARAEAVLDVVTARTEAAHRVALSGLRGRVSREAGEIRDHLLAALAYLIARIDFPDEDVPEQDIRPDLAAAAARLRRLLDGAKAGALYRDGARLALAGPPNAGKSSLLNRLLREERAIVTPVAGTTRDTLAETANIGGVPVTIIDTAGFSDDPDPIEAIGIERARKAAAEADMVAVVFDRSAPAPALDTLLSLADSRPALAVLNKSDLPPAPWPALPLPSVAVSALTGDGIDTLEATIVDLLSGGAAIGAGEVVVANPRHTDALRRALERLDQAQHSLDDGMPEDFISIDLRAALDILGEITGETATEDLLGEIFARFCIGK